MTCDGKWNAQGNSEVLAANVFFDRWTGERGSVFVRFRRQQFMVDWLRMMDAQEIGGGKYEVKVCNRFVGAYPADVVNARELDLRLPQNEAHPLAPRYLDQVWLTFTPDQVEEAISRKGWGKGKDSKK